MLLDHFVCPLSLLPSVNAVLKKCNIVSIPIHNMPVNSIIANVDFTLWKPSMQILVTFVNNFIILFVPVDLICPLIKKFLLIFDASVIDLVVLFIFKVMCASLSIVDVLV